MRDDVVGYVDKLNQNDTKIEDEIQIINGNLERIKEMPIGNDKPNRFKLQSLASILTCNKVLESFSKNFSILNQDLLFLFRMYCFLGTEATGRGWA